MKYTGPKFKLCRREWINLFGSSKYDVKKRRTLPGQHGWSMARLSEYGKLLRNKQVLKRSYLLSEKQFSAVVKTKSSKYSKNKGVSHDNALFILLESRLDVLIFRSGFANTIMQARQMVNHGHFLLNGVKHNIPSTMLKVWDKIVLKEKLQKSSLYSSMTNNFKAPSWLKVNKNSFEIELVSTPKMWELENNADLLKVIEYYARA